MDCPRCGGGTKVIMTNKCVFYILRYRKCEDCGECFQSVEMMSFRGYQRKAEEEYREMMGEDETA